MKAITRALVASVGWLVCVLTTDAEAVTFNLAPSLSQAITSNSQGRVGLKFDLSSLSQVSSDDIQSAHLEWSLTGVSNNSRSAFALFVAQASWTTASDVGNVTLPEEPARTWDIEVQDFQRAGGFVRFDVTDLVKEWKSGSSNYGLFITTPHMTAQSLSGQLSNARLVVR